MLTLQDITGIHDHPFCGVFALDLPIWETQPNCNTSPGGQIATTANFYPNAKNFTLYHPDAGHCWHLHEVANASFALAHQWLEDQGF